MFKIAMTALILSMGVDDKDVDKVYDKFLSMYGSENPDDINNLVAHMRKAIEVTT